MKKTAGASPICHRCAVSPLRYRSYVVILVAFLILSLIPGAAAFPSATEPSKPSPSLTAPPTTPVVIPLGDIAAKATETSTFLTNLATSVAQRAQDQNIANSVAALTKRLDERLRETKETLETEPALETLQTLQQGWQRDQVKMSAWLNTLTQHASTLQNGLNQLGIIRQTWSNTRLSAEQSNVPAPILERVDSTLAAISEAQATLQTERTAILNLQNRVAEDLSKCATALAQIAQAQQTVVAGILAPDASPIWRVDLWPNAIQALPRHVREVTHARWSDFVRYVREPREGSGFHAALFLVLAFLFNGARRKFRGWVKSGVPTAPAVAVFMRPFSAALAITLVYATSPFVEVAAAVRPVLLIAALVPLVRVIQPLVTRSIAVLSYAVCAVFAVEIVRQSYTGVPVIGQTILVVENLARLLLCSGSKKIIGKSLQSEPNHRGR